MEEVKTEAFLPKGEIVVGLTSGASTPDAYMEQVMLRLSELSLSIRHRFESRWTPPKPANETVPHTIYRH